LSRVLVATDIAARGIDVDGVTHVVNYDMPDVPENYVHRIGRTARAGAGGTAIAFCAPDEREELHAVEKLIRIKIPVRPVPPGIAHPSSGPGGAPLPKYGAAPAPHAHPHAAPRHPAPQPQTHAPASGAPARPAAPPQHPVAQKPPRRFLWRKRHR